MPDAIRWYDQNVSDVSRRYESVAAETVHGWLVDLLPNAPALVLDIGAGTGRDAAWLASRGLEVVAVRAVRRHARRSATASSFALDPPGSGAEARCYKSEFDIKRLCLPLASILKQAAYR